MILYYFLRFVRLENIVLIYLALSPFYILTSDDQSDLVKMMVYKSLSFIIVLWYAARKIISFNTRVYWGGVWSLLLIFYAWLLFSTLLPWNQYTIDTPSNILDSSFGRAMQACIIATVTFCCFQIIDSDLLLRIIKWFYNSIFISFLGVLWNLWSKNYQVGKTLWAYRLNSIMHDPNIFGLYLVFIILLSYLFFLKDKTGYYRIKYAVIGLLSLCVLFYTFSRSALLILILTIVLLFFLVPRKDSRKILIIIGFILLLIGGWQISKRLNRESPQTLRHYFSDYIRVSINVATIGLIKDHWVMGVGYENARFLLKKYQNARFPLVFIGQAIHNVYLQIFAELGIGGLAIFLTIGWMLARKSLSLTKKYEFPSNLIFLFSFLSLIAYVIHGSVYHYYFNNHAFYTIMLILISGIRYETLLIHKIEALQA